MMDTYTPYTHCSHGNEFINDCQKCDEVWARMVLIPDARHNRLMGALRDLRWKLWRPKCSQCGKRWKCNEKIEHNDIPF